MKDLNYAKKILLTGEYTCVMCKDGKTYTSTHRGVKPLVTWYTSGACFSDFCAADKVVGKATAFLYVLLGVKTVYAGVLSRSALQVLKENGIYFEYGTLVDNIINRKGDGICPFEQAVLDIDNTQQAYEAVLNKMSEMGIELK